MINIDKMHSDLQKISGKFKLPTEPDKDETEALGTLDIGNKVIKFVSDSDYIFANEIPIMFCYDDCNTARAVFIETMKMVSGSSFKDLFWKKSKKRKKN